MDQWRRQAQIIHLALVGGVVLALMVFAVVRRTSTGVSAAVPAAQALGILGGAMLVAAIGAAALLARRREGAPEGDDDSRRRRAFTTLVAIWAMGEGAALLSGVAWLLAGGWCSRALACCFWWRTPPGGDCRRNGRSRAPGYVAALQRVA